MSVPPEVRDLVGRVARLYTARSPSHLCGLFASTYHSNGTFVDPFVKASPAREARLQFLALQRIFSSVTAEASQPVVVDSGGGTLDVAFDVHWRYVWNRSGPVMRRLLPEATVVEGTVHLQVDKAANKVLTHTDTWRSPRVLPLLMPLRALNAWVTNATFRLLGWEKDLMEAERRLQAQ